MGFADLPQELGRVFCERALDEWGFTLERYALHSVKNCPARPVRLAFDKDIQLTAPEITIRDGRLRLDAHFRSEDELRLARYSLAVHVIDSRSGERVAQGDTGIGPGFIVPFRSEIDISALPPGDYELRVALYDWQTGERLSARDLETRAKPATCIFCSASPSVERSGSPVYHSVASGECRPGSIRKGSYPVYGHKHAHG